MNGLLDGQMDVGGLMVQLASRSVCLLVGTKDIKENFQPEMTGMSKKPTGNDNKHCFHTDGLWRYIFIVDGNFEKYF